MRLAIIHSSTARPRAAAVRTVLRSLSLTAPGPAAVVLLTHEAPGDPAVESALRRARAARLPIVGLRLDAVAPAQRWLRAAGPIRWYDAFDGLNPAGLSQLADAPEHLTKDTPGSIVPFHVPVPTATSRRRPMRLRGLRPTATPLQTHGWVSCVAGSPDGSVVAMGWRSGAVSTWDAKHGERLLHAKGAPITALAIAGSNRRLVATRADGSLALWDLQTGNQEAALRQGPQPPIALINGGATLLAARGERLETWELGTPAQPTWETPGLFKRITRIAVDALGHSVFLEGHSALSRAENIPTYGIYARHFDVWSRLSLPGPLLRVRGLDPDDDLTLDELLSDAPQNVFSVLTRGGVAGIVNRQGATFNEAGKVIDGAAPLDFLPWGRRWLLFAQDPRDGEQLLRVHMLNDLGTGKSETLVLPGIPKFVSVFEDRIQVLVSIDGKPGIYGTNVPFRQV